MDINVRNNYVILNKKLGYCFEDAIKEKHKLDVPHIKEQLC